MIIFLSTILVTLILFWIKGHFDYIDKQLNDYEAKMIADEQNEFKD